MAYRCDKSRDGLLISRSAENTFGGSIGVFVEDERKARERW